MKMRVGERFRSYVSCTVEEFALISLCLSLSLRINYFIAAHILYLVTRYPNARIVETGALYRYSTRYALFVSRKLRRIFLSSSLYFSFSSSFLVAWEKGWRERKRVVEYNNAMIPFLCDSGGYIVSSARFLFQRAGRGSFSGRHAYTGSDFIRDSVFYSRLKDKIPLEQRPLRNPRLWNCIRISFARAQDRPFLDVLLPEENGGSPRYPNGFVADDTREGDNKTH